MKLKLHENSLFAVLLRSPWWISAAVAAGLFFLIRIWFAPMYAAFAALPFTVIACYVAWQQLRQPSPEKIQKKLAGIRALSAEEFAAAIEAGFRREGYGVARLEKGPVDMELSKGGRVSLVVYRRWKAAHSGIGPLEELSALRRKQKADECIFITAGELSGQARQFAGEKDVKLVEGQGLINLTR